MVPELVEGWPLIIHDYKPDRLYVLTVLRGQGVKFYFFNHEGHEDHEDWIRDVGVFLTAFFASEL